MRKEGLEIPWTTASFMQESHNLSWYSPWWPPCHHHALWERHRVQAQSCPERAPGWGWSCLIGKEQNTQVLSCCPAPRPMLEGLRPELRQWKLFSADWGHQGPAAASSSQVQSASFPISVHLLWHTHHFLDSGLSWQPSYVSLSICRS